MMGLRAQIAPAMEHLLAHKTLDSGMFDRQT
jgi:hypothetical protein